MSTQTHPTPDQIIAARRARLAAEARNAELSLAAWEHECAERAQQNTGTSPVRSARIHQDGQLILSLNRFGQWS